MTKIVEVWNKRLHFYTGNYAKYEQQRQDRRTQLEAAYKNQRERIEDLEAFINRFRYQATKAKQVQSRIKELDKIERVVIPDEESAIHFTFPQPQASGRTVVEVQGLHKNYGPKHVLRGVDFTIERGDRIALVGANGAGKSTLVRLLSAQEPPTSGALKLGHNVLPEFFAQDQYKVLDPAARMFDDISAIAPRVPDAELRGLLGCFLFSGDDVYKPLGVLSGGERNRYALAKILVSPANFLLLDEPTNHLDMRAKDVLLDAVKHFQGTVVFVSHDRYFIDGAATRVFEVEDGHVHVYPGNYEDYLFRKEGLVVKAEVAAHANGTPLPVTAKPVAEPAPAVQEARGKKLNPIKFRQMQERLQTVEEEIPRCEAAIAVTEGQMANYSSAEETQRLAAQLDRLRAEHTALNEEWEELMLQVEEQGALK